MHTETRAYKKSISLSRRLDFDSVQVLPDASMPGRHLLQPENDFPEAKVRRPARRVGQSPVQIPCGTFNMIRQLL